jgi:hypothetical protein
MYGEKGNVFSILMGCPKQNRTIGPHRLRLKVILKWILEK